MTKSSIVMIVSFFFASAALVMLARKYKQAKEVEHSTDGMILLSVSIAAGVVFFISLLIWAIE